MNHSPLINRRLVLGGALTASIAAFGDGAAALADQPPEAHADIRAFIQKMYQTIWFDKGEWLDGEGMKSLMHPGARVGWTENGATRMVDIDEFLELFGNSFRKDAIYALHERSLRMKILTFGDVAQVFDAYEAVFNDGDPVVRGVNAFQLVKANGAWKCVSLVWSEATPENPLPPEGI